MGLCFSAVPFLVVMSLHSYTQENEENTSTVPGCVTRRQDEQGDCIHLPYCGIEAPIPVLLTDLKEVFGFSAQQILEVQARLASCDSLLLLKVLKWLAKVIVEDLSLCDDTERPLHLYSRMSLLESS